MKNKYKEYWKFKVELKENNSFINSIIINNCLDLINLCKEYCFSRNNSSNKKKIIKYINKSFGTIYTNNKIKRIAIEYNNRTIYRGRTYYNANMELYISIYSIRIKKFKKIRKANKFIRFRKKFMNNNWYNYITYDNYPSQNIYLDPIMDNLEINIITEIKYPNHIYMDDKNNLYRNTNIKSGNNKEPNKIQFGDNIYSLQFDINSNRNSSNGK